MPSTKKASPNYLFFLMCAIWAFDFRSEQGGQSILVQGPMLAVYIICLVSIWIQYAKNKYNAKIPGLFPFMASGILFILVGTGSGLLNHQSPYDVLRNAISTSVYLTATYATAIICANDELPKFVALRRHLGWLSAIFLIITPVNVMLTSGINLDTVRFQILGGSLISTLGYATAITVSSGSLFEFGALTLAMTLLIISVTRTYVIGFGFQMLPAGQALFRKTSAFLGPVVALLVLVASIGILFGGGEDSFTDRWTQRIFNQHAAGGEDYTYQTRASEWEFMTDAWLTDAGTVLVGNGLAAVSIYNIPAEIGGGTETDIGFGHGEHLSLFFMAGILGGGPFLLFQLLQALSGFVFIVRQSSAVGKISDPRFLAVWGAATIIGYFVSGIFSSPLYFRDWALWYGIGTGLYLGCRTRVENPS